MSSSARHGHVGSAHLPWLGLGFFVVIPVIGGLIYGPLIYRYAREARGHGVPEVMIAVAENGGRIRPQVSVVKALASALCIGTGGSVGREGPIVQIGSALASSLGQRVEDAGEPDADPGRLRRRRRHRRHLQRADHRRVLRRGDHPAGVLHRRDVHRSCSRRCSPTWSPSRSSATGRSCPASRPASRCTTPRNYLLVAVLAVVAALIGLLFKTVLYKIEDLWDIAWKNRPEWARPAVGGVALGLILLALPQMYGVGYPVMYKAIAGDYALWFLLVLAAGKILACSTTLGIGGSGGVFAPSLFIGVTSGMAFGEIADHIFGPGAGQPALYAVVAMGAVFTSAARAPLTSLASVVEMTGDFTLTLPVMLAVAIATATSRALSYGTIYTTKLLRRGQDIDRAAPWRAFGDLKAADVMRPFPGPWPSPPTAGPAPPAQAGGAWRRWPARSPTRATRRPYSPASPSPRRCARSRPTAATGCPCCPATASRCRAGSPAPASCTPSPARSAAPAAGRASRTRRRGQPARNPPAQSHPTRCPATRSSRSPSRTAHPASGQALGAITWPPGTFPVSILHDRSLQDADPRLTLAPGDRVNLLARAPQHPAPQLPHGNPDGRPHIADRH